MENRRRKATRLEGFDYSQPAEYFVTICTKDRACVLGEVVDGIMVLSEAGRIVEAAWTDIPAHFQRVRADVLRVMPDHVHGIIEILDKPTPPRIPCRGGVPPPQIPRTDGVSPPKKGDETSPCRGLINQTPTGDRMGWPLMAQRGISLGKIVRSFKARSCRSIHRSGMESFEWQRSYHDRIIRSDIERFYIERYIELNPLLWCFEHDNPSVHEVPTEELRRVLQRDHGLDEYAIGYILERFTDHRAWRGVDGAKRKEKARPYLDF